MTTQPPTFKKPNALREVLEKTKLSRFPNSDAPECQLTKAHAAIACAGCGGRLDGDDSLQQSFNGCRKCIGIYARIDAAIEETAKRRKIELLEKFTGGAK